MKYFKDMQDNPYALEEDLPTATLAKVIAEHGLIEISADEYVAMTTPSPEELAELDRQMQITGAKAYLASTDWIVTKMAETVASGGDIASLLTKYADELSVRVAKRELINQLDG